MVSALFMLHLQGRCHLLDSFIVLFAIRTSDRKRSFEYVMSAISEHMVGGASFAVLQVEAMHWLATSLLTPTDY
jgi:hypothetical protein